jgi:nitrate/TMAO reductase-like tetraheme cytochrome c subunit
MKRLAFGTLIALAMVLSSCAPQTKTQSVTETSAETEVVAAPAPDSSECLACHTDKERLIQTAKPDEVDHEAESKGVG